MSLRPEKLDALGFTGVPSEQVQGEAKVIPVAVVQLAIAPDNGLDIGAPAKVKEPKLPTRAQMGFYWQELNKKYWAADGTGIRCGTCAFFDDGTKPNEPRKDEYNLVGKCKIMDIEDKQVHSQACCNLYRRPRDAGAVNPENEMWPPTYSGSCPPSKGKLVLKDVCNLAADETKTRELEQKLAAREREVKLLKEQKAAIEKQLGDQLKAKAITAAEAAASLRETQKLLAEQKKLNSQLKSEQTHIKQDRVELKKQAADAAKKLNKTTAEVQQTLTAVQKTT